MITSKHREPHFMASDTFRDIVIGMSDGLTVPFAIAAGMSGASVAVTLVALFPFGYVKGRVTGINALRSGLQTTLIGGLAAGAAFAIARLIG